MNIEKLHDAMNYIDDDMINAVDSLRRKKMKKKSKLPFVISTVAAACICVFLCLAVIVMTNPKKHNAGLLDGSSDADVLIATNAPTEGSVKETLKPRPSLGTDKPPAVVPETTGIPDGGVPSLIPQKTPNATPVPKETSPNEDWADGEYDEPADATDMPQDEPTYSLSCVTVEVISSNNDSFNCIATGNNEYSEIQDGEIVELVAEDSAIAEHISYNINKIIKVYFSKYDYDGRIVAERIEEVR